MSMRWPSRCFFILMSATVAVTLPAHADTVVHTERSLYRQILVFDDDELRCMRFTKQSGGRQSCIDRAHPQRVVFDYVKMMLASLAVNPAPRSILIVGLGGGTLVDVLQRALPDADIDIAEIDPAVVRVATTYFDLRLGPHAHVHEEDGRVYVKRALRAGKKYDLVMLDAFDHEYIPEHLLTQEFLREVKGLLAPGGIVAANTFSSSRLYDHESATYASVFGTFYNVKSNNRVIIARPDGLPAQDVVKANAERVRPLLAPFDVDPVKFVAQFNTKPDWQRDARVLTDRYSPSNLLNAPGRS
jgi:spermidine synthase